MAKLGKATIYPVGAFNNKDLLSEINAYKKIITNSYTLISGDEIGTRLSFPLLVSTKLDGESWYLIFDNEWILVAPNGRSIKGELPILEDAKAAKLDQKTIYGGELHILGEERTRIADLSILLGQGSKAQVEKLAFGIWDVVRSSEISAAGSSYESRYEYLKKIKNSKNLFIVPSSVATNAEQLASIFTEECGRSGAEGLICRSVDGRTFKVKPSKEFDAAIIGFTEKLDSNGKTTVRSLLFGVLADQDKWIPISTSGNVGDEVMRSQLHSKLIATTVESDYRLVSRSSGVLYKLVKPTIVAELKCLDIQLEDSQGKSIRDPLLILSDRWKVAGWSDSAAIHNTVLVQIRDDKSPTQDLVGWNQITRLVPIPESIGITQLSASEVIKRQVWVKKSDEKQDIRKLVVWKTNKSNADYPEFVVHWTDFSATRKSPLDREVRLAKNEEDALAIAESMITENIKKGWELAK